MTPAQSLLLHLPATAARVTAYKYARHAFIVVYISAILPCTNCSNTHPTQHIFSGAKDAYLKCGNLRTERITLVYVLKRDVTRGLHYAAMK
jgi:hypothetical protein